MKFAVEVIPFPEFAHRKEQFGSVTALGSKAVVESADAFDYETLRTYLTQKYGGYCKVQTGTLD